MLFRSLTLEDKEQYNRIIDHPLQSWEWGEFQKKIGAVVERAGFFEDGKLKQAFQVTFNKIPLLPNNTAGYFPKGTMPDVQTIDGLKKLAKKHNAIFIKLEPEALKTADIKNAYKKHHEFLSKNDCVPGRHIFYKHTYILDLTKPEDTLFKNLESKTRYNVRLAFKKGVRVIEDSTKQGLAEYNQILNETKKRQNFELHNPAYFEKMWKTFQDTEIMKIFKAVYNNQTLVSWIVFAFKDTIYYPYGASRSIHKEVMASNLMLWRMVQFGQEQKLKKFDLWGCLGPNAKKTNKWYGFHRFKRGYNGQLMQNIGSYDLITNHSLYSIYRKAEIWKWKLIKLKDTLGF